MENVFGGSTIWHSEVDKSATRVLGKNWPDTPNLGDITKIDWDKVARVSVIGGGSPCQDMSQAGQRAGMSSGTRSGLWEHMRIGIELLRPEFVVWENVRGAFSAKANSKVEQDEGRVGALRAFGRVLGDLSDLGYDSEWCVVRASDTEAPHQRERVFVLATSTDAVSPRRPGNWAERGSEEVPRATRLVDSVDSRWGIYSERVSRWSSRVGTPPRPFRRSGRDGHFQYSPEFSEWVMGVPVGWTETEGVSRSQRLKMLGNGVHVQQAEYALNYLLTKGEL